MTPREFIEKFPLLGETIISKCKSESLPIDGVKPYITKENIGGILNPDEECQIRCFTPRDKLKSHLMGSLLAGILQQQVWCRN